MSKVKIKGNASGTGVLTIEAPNTNTDRTITLPDGTGTLLNSDGEGTSVLSTGETGGTKYLREDGDGTCSWQPVSSQTAYRYWKYECQNALISHHPRVSRIVMEDDTGVVTTIQTFVSDNCSDNGTIPSDGTSYTYDFSTPVVIKRVGGYVSYGDGERAAWIKVYGSTDNSTWIDKGTTPFYATTCGVVTGDI